MHDGEHERQLVRYDPELHYIMQDEHTLDKTVKIVRYRTVRNSLNLRRAAQC